MSDSNPTGPAPWAPGEHGAFIVELGADGQPRALHAFRRRRESDTDDWSILEVADLRGVELRGVDPMPPMGWIEEVGEFNFFNQHATRGDASMAALVAFIETTDSRLRLDEGPKWRFGGGRRSDPEATSSPRLDLLYAVDEMDTLVFIPKGLALAMLDARRRLTRCRSWGDAHRLLSDEWFARLVDDYAVGQPDDGESLDGQTIAESWPAVTHGSIGEWVPAGVLERHGEAFSTMLDSGVNIPAEDKADVFRSLAAAGARSRRDNRILDLFVDPA